MALERLSQSEQDVFMQLMTELDQASSDPAKAISTIERARGLTDRLKSYLTRPRPERIYKVPFASGVILQNSGLVSTPRVPLQFPKAGRVIGIKCVVVEAAITGAFYTLTSPLQAPLLSHLTLSAVDAGGYPFFSNGTAEAFVSFAALAASTTSEALPAGWFPFLFRRVKAYEQWTFQVSSDDTMPPAGSTLTLKPEVTLLVEHDETN